MSLPATQDRKTQLEQLLRAGVYCASGLKEILNDEREALERRNTDGLNETAKNKQRFLTRLEDLEVERGEICNASGFDSEPSAMEQLLNSYATDSPLHEYWAHFVDLARECSELNTRNGAIINVRRQQIAGALSVIRGETQDSETYSQNGRETGSNSRRILAEI